MFSRGIWRAGYLPKGSAFRPQGLSNIFSRNVMNIHSKENGYTCELSSSTQDVDSFFYRVFGSKSYIPNQALKEQIFTHKSYKQGRVAYNEPLISLGVAVVDVSLMNHFLKDGDVANVPKYSDITRFRSPRRIASATKDWQPESAARCMLPLLDVKSTEKPPLERVLSTTIFSLVAAIYLQKGGQEALKFCDEHLVTQLVHQNERIEK
ncbi:ribosomal protein subunit L15 [Schizosaccharomyces cryophilus OY26]|uniref:Ribosomal protein subunit L15 n=1 Tax=Schizosaccharomyces cryophilus (strain OY26 / ATCC MYA-4695 / CBS 11777 / NBRC 106824 / NRRL Y48691) TaxID=653667 RepID=S9XFV3_SCHCR|nr:ribosomal protein subunit L15 [Schizosaccharomyces cryophilus OY26]EPY52516.1 ribosomal protein subunit L15 [Schizosaccharomyces cryophilus OY26]